MIKILASLAAAASITNSIPAFSPTPTGPVVVTNNVKVGGQTNALRYNAYTYGMAVNPPANYHLLRQWTNNTASFEIWTNGPLRKEISYTNSNWTHLSYTHFHTFVGFVPNSMDEIFFNTFISKTNSKTHNLWELPPWADRPKGWPKTTFPLPKLRWDTNGITYGLRGITAFSECYTHEGVPGQAPHTLVTKRHVIWRGHGSGPPTGLIWTNSRAPNDIVFWSTTNNAIVTNRWVYAITVGGIPSNPEEQYSVGQLVKDMPDSIPPIRWGNSEMRQYGNNRTLNQSSGVYIMFVDRQIGTVGFPGSYEYGPEWMADTGGGDSGGMRFLLWTNEVIYYNQLSGNITPSNLQKDIDTLCEKEGLNTNNYQLQFYPEFQ